MNKIIITFFGLLSFLISCGVNDDNNYRNDVYKAYAPNHKISDLGIINDFLAPKDSFWVYFSQHYRVEEINNYSDFEIKYGVYKDSVGIDSSYFVNNKIFCFNIITEAGKIENYTYEIIADSIVLNCKVLKQQEKENGYLAPKTLTSYVIKKKKLLY